MNSQTCKNSIAIGVRYILWLLIAVEGGRQTLQAQTTLVGDHIITGDVSVGVSGTAKNLTVTGNVGIGMMPGAQTLSITTSSSEAISIWNAGSAVGMNILLTDETLSAGYAAPLGSIGVGEGQLEVKYGDADYEWGPAVFQDRNGATAIGSGWAVGDYSFAHGPGSMAGGIASVAMGISFAIADYSFAVGAYTNAEGRASAALGDSTYSEGDLSVAMGENTIAGAYASLVIGRGNIVQGSNLIWTGTDPAFVVGNGTYAMPSNAFTVYQNGDVEMTGKIKMPVQGDILMGEFGPTP